MEQNPVTLFLNDLSLSEVDLIEIYFGTYNDTVIVDITKEGMETIVDPNIGEEYIIKYNAFTYNGVEPPHILNNLFRKYSNAVFYIHSTINALNNQRDIYNYINEILNNLQDVMVLLTTNRHQNLSFFIPDSSPQLKQPLTKFIKAYNATELQRRFGNILKNDLENLKVIYSDIAVHEFSKESVQLPFNKDEYNLYCVDFESAYRKLKAGKFIASEVSLSTFRSAIKGQASIRVKWTGTEEALCYFIKVLNSGRVPFFNDKTNRLIWQAVINVFYDKNGYDFKDKDTIRKSSTPPSSSETINLLNEITNLLLNCKK